MFVLKMYVQIMSLSVLLCNVCVCYVYILKMSKKIKVKKKKKYQHNFQTAELQTCLHSVLQLEFRAALNNLAIQFCRDIPL